MKYYFPIYIDGGNRGCEGIAKGTALLLGESKDSLIGFCSNIPLDEQLGSSKYFTLKRKKTFSRNFFKRAIRKIRRIIGGPFKISDPYVSFVNKMSPNDILISTGGDMMCYSNNQVITTNNEAHKNGNKTILWGCSMGPENLTPEKEDTLRKFSLIYTRDTLTYNFFKQLGLENIVCYPDPAFILKPEKTNLPKNFDNKKIIGLNLSNFTIGDEKSLITKMGEEVIQLIDYILKETEYEILLIPHVFWTGQDDRILANLIKNHFNSSRINILDSNKLNYLQIRYVISKCDIFIGARTHAMISAYSTYVPSLALGYSIKSRGIAQDLGLSDKLIFDTKNFESGDLIKAFKYLESHKQEIKNHLKEIMPVYIEKTYEIKKEINRLIS